jgi:predicted Fe-Mo cluster-binding NifX family protein
VQPIFGRCEYFIFVNPASMESEVVANPFASLSEEAGVESAEFVIGKGATTLLTGQVGPKVRQSLEAAGVVIMSIKGGTVREAVEAYRMPHPT